MQKHGFKRHRVKNTDDRPADPLLLNLDKVTDETDVPDHLIQFLEHRRNSRSIYFVRSSDQPEPTLLDELRDLSTCYYTAVNNEGKKSTPFTGTTKGSRTRSEPRCALPSPALVYAQ